MLKKSPVQVVKAAKLSALPLSYGPLRVSRAGRTRTCNLSIMVGMFVGSYYRVRGVSVGRTSKSVRHCVKKPRASRESDQVPEPRDSNPADLRRQASHVLPGLVLRWWVCKLLPLRTRVSSKTVQVVQAAKHSIALPTKLQARKRPVGLEPTTYRLNQFVGFHYRVRLCLVSLKYGEPGALASG